MSLLSGYGYQPIEVAGDDPNVVHHDLATAIDGALDSIGEIQHHAGELKLHGD